jgi:hypothetical protein
VPTLDHFKCYPVVASTPHPETVGLRDQFGSQTRLVARAGDFCNPAEKTHQGTITPIRNPDAHLTFYELEVGPAQQPARVVDINNQFGPQQISVGEATLLGVPTQKGAHPAPTNLDHFLCYHSTTPGPNVNVDLKDQYTPVSDTVTVGQVVFFCNPVEKTHNGVIFPITQPLNHLTCYITNNADNFSAFEQIRNQITGQPETIQLINPRFLCVPTQKLAFSTVSPTPIPTP